MHDFHARSKRQRLWCSDKEGATSHRRHKDKPGRQRAVAVQNVNNMTDLHRGIMSDKTNGKTQDMDVRRQNPSEGKKTTGRKYSLVVS